MHWLTQIGVLMCNVQGDNFGLLLSCVDFVLVVTLSPWKGGNLAVEQQDAMAEHPNQSQPDRVKNLSCHVV